MKNNPVGWFEIYVADMNRAKKFYESVFELKLENMKMDFPDLEMFLFPHSEKASGAGGGLCKMKGFEAGKNSVLVYFSCEDCAVVEKRVETFGGKIMNPKMSIGENGFISLVFDTEGNMIGLHSMK